MRKASDENAIKEASEENNASLLYDTEEEFEETEIVKYNLGNRVGPHLFQEYVDSNTRDELDRCLQKDLAWATTIGISLENQNKLTRSWIDFNKKIINVEQTKSLREYLPTIAEPLEYPVCKKFLDDLRTISKSHRCTF